MRLRRGGRGERGIYAIASRASGYRAQMRRGCSSESAMRSCDRSEIKKDEWRWLGWRRGGRGSKDAAREVVPLDLKGIYHEFS